MKTSSAEFRELVKQVRAGGRKSDSFPFIPPGEPGIPRSCVTSVLADTLSKARAAPAPRSVSTVVELAVLITAILGCALAYGTWEWGRSLGRAEAREESESQSFGDPVLTAETKRRGEDIGERVHLSFLAGVGSAGIVTV